MCIVLKPTLFICNKLKFQFYRFFLLFRYKTQSNVDFEVSESKKIRSWEGKNSVATKDLDVGRAISIKRPLLLSVERIGSKSAWCKFLILLKAWEIAGINHCVRKLILPFYMNSRTMKELAAWSSAVFNTFLPLHLCFTKRMSERERKRVRLGERRKSHTPK